MAKRVQLIRHAATAADAFLGKIGEVTVDTTAKSLRVHDGSTAGGFTLARADLANVAAATAAAAGKMTAAQATLLAGALQSSGLGSVTQAFSAALLSIAGLTTNADRMIYSTAANVYAVATLTAFARSILDDADAAAVRATLGLGTVATLNNGAVDADTLDGLDSLAFALADHLHGGVYEPVFSKNTAFNLALGTSGGQVAEGNHGHSGLVTNGDSHNHSGGAGATIAISNLSGAVNASQIAANTIVSGHINVGYSSGNVIYQGIGPGNTYYPSDTITGIAEVDIVLQINHGGNWVSASAGWSGTLISNSSYLRFYNTSGSTARYLRFLIL